MMKKKNTNFQDIKKRILSFNLLRYLHLCILIQIFILLFPVYSYSEPFLLWRKTFDSRIIKTSQLLDYKPVRGEEAEFPLKTVMTEKNICILDNHGDIAQKISIEEYDRATISDNGMILATLKGREISISNIENRQIQGILNIADPQPVVLPQHVSFELSPNGEHLVLLSYFTNTIYFYKQKGDLFSKHSFKDLKGAEIKFSKDSRYTAIHVPNWGEGKTNGYLLFYNEKGEELWQFYHKGCEAKFDISSDGSLIALAAEDWLYTLNKKGKVVYKKELLSGGMDIKLSDYGRYTVLTRTSDHSISLLDNENFNLLWTYNINGFDPINSPFTSLDISGKGDNIAIALSKDWTKSNKESFLYLFNKSGNIVVQDTFDESKIHCSLSSDGKSILIGGNKEVYVYGSAEYKLSNVKK